MERRSKLKYPDRQITVMRKRPPKTAEEVRAWLRFIAQMQRAASQ